MKPKTTFKVVIHDPDLGACFSQEGKRAKSVKGSASAKAKPNMPMPGAIQFPLVVVSTRSRPMMGAVHENDTNTNVKAMRKMLSSPVVDDAFESTAFAHESGSLISNHPKKLSANTTNNRNRKMLNMAFVDIAFSVSLPEIAVTNSPNPK